MLSSSGISLSSRLSAGGGRHLRAETDAVVRQFQRDRGLAVDGIVGPRPGALQADALANQVYIVKKGDTLSHIAKAYSVSLDELIQANDLASTVIYPGQTLVIPAAAAAMKRRNMWFAPERIYQ